MESTSNSSLTARLLFFFFQDITLSIKRRKEFLDLKAESMSSSSGRGRHGLHLGLGLFGSEKAHTEAHKTRSFLRSNWLGTR